jgi:ubiquinone/menaquinone biosynthesis C-methylase UbiE
MKLTQQEQVTIEAYDQNAAAWSDSRNVKGYWREELDTFYSYLPEGKVLEVGAGGGRDAKEFISHGYEYVGTDISKGLLAEARKHNPGVQFLEQSVYELDFPENTFDGFWACATLLHMPKDRIDQALQSIHTVVRDQGIGAITLKKGDGERFVEGDHVGLSYRRFFAFYQEEEFARILDRNKFEVIESYETEHSNKPWLVFFVKIRKTLEYI